MPIFGRGYPIKAAVWISKPPPAPAGSPPVFPRRRMWGLLATYPIATLPFATTTTVTAGVFSSAGVGALTGIGRSFASAAYVSAGVGTLLANATAINPAVFASAGVGALTAVGRSTSSAVFAASGAGVLLGTAQAFAASVFAAAGVGALTAVGRSTASSVFAAAGVGSISGVLRATSSSVFNASGVGSLSGITGILIISSTFSSSGFGNVFGLATAIKTSVFSSAGQGSMATISYAFYGDSEVAKVYQEIRTASVPMENKVLTKLDADREEEVGEEERVAGPPNRTRH